MPRSAASTSNSSRSIIRRGLLACILGLALIVASTGGPKAGIAQSPGNASAGANSQQPDSIPGLQRFDVQRIVLPQTAGTRLDIALTLDGQPRRLRLEPHSMRSPGFEVLTQDQSGEIHRTVVPGAKTYRGTIEGLPGSRVAATVRGGEVSARIESATGEIWQIQPMSRLGGGAASTDHAVYRADDLVPDVRGCGATIGQGAARISLKDFAHYATANTAAAVRRVCDIAFDADFEFYQINGSSVAATVQDIEDIINQVALIYEDQINVTFEVTTIVVRTAEPDPYTETANALLLNEFQNEWNVSMAGVHRDIAHLMTGKDLDDNVIGSAWPDQVCSVCGFARGYGLSQSHYTFFMPSRVCLTAHEIGHNFGATHCNTNGNSDPDCSIMCATIGSCSGSCTTFGSTALSVLSETASSSTCLVTLAPPVDLPFCDAFDTGIDSALWSYNAVASISAGANNAPSPPQVLALDDCCTGCAAAPDDIRSNFIRLGGVPSATFSYHTQHAGNFFTNGAELIVDYRNADGQWAEINRIVSDGTSSNPFEFWSHALPFDALHDAFRIRFRLDSAFNQANWFIDDVSVTQIAPDSPVLRVRGDAPDGGNGSSWAGAFNDLQKALAVAGCSGGIVEEIWIAAGTYWPDGGTRDKSATFTLINGVAVYGGFSGHETLRDQRDPQANVVILSGDIGLTSTAIDNSYHVVWAVGVDSTAMLDGVTISDGRATGSSPNDVGGGMYIGNGSPTVAHCKFTNNAAANGGAAFVSTGSNPNFEECTFIDNSATIAGGAVHNTFVSVSTFLNCRFLGNEAVSSGGAIFNSSASIIVTNGLFSGNMASSGGAIQNFQGSAGIINSTFSQNTASNIGGGIINSSSSASIQSTILWGNTDSNGSGESAQLGGNDPVNSFTVAYSIVEGWTGAIGGSGNLGDDPLFVDSDGDDNVAGTADDDLRQQGGSPAFNAGDLFSPPPSTADLDGHARILCARVDMGAYEYGFGDPNCDQAVDLADFLNWTLCVTGPDATPFPNGCHPFDGDKDLDVDLRDLASYLNAFTGTTP